MDSTFLASQAVEMLRAAAGAGGAVATSLAGSALWDWIKSKCKFRPTSEPKDTARGVPGSKPEPAPPFAPESGSASSALAKVVGEIERGAADDAHWKALDRLLVQLLEENRAFHKDFLEALSKTPSGAQIVQNMTANGSGNVQIQVAGDKANIHIGR